MKPLRSSLLLALLISATLWSVTVWASACQVVRLPDPGEKIAATIPIDPALYAALVKAISGRPPGVLPGRNLLITSLDESGGWAMSTVAQRPLVPDEGQSILDNSTLVIARSVGGRWMAAIMGTAAYEQLLAAAPDTLVSAEVKPFLQSPEYGAPHGPAALALSLKWPWRAGQTWKYSQGRHGTNNSAIDLAPLWAIPAEARAVAAAAGGIVIRRCDDDVQTNLAIRHTTGGSRDDVTGYLHLDRSTVNRPHGSFIGPGQVLGITYNNPIPNDPEQHPCGWSTGPHVHFYQGTIPAGSNSSGSISAVDLLSTTISGWTLGADNCFRSESETRCVNASFTSDNAGAAVPSPTGAATVTPTRTATPTATPTPSSPPARTPTPARTLTPTTTPTMVPHTGELAGQVSLQGRADHEGATVFLDGTPMAITGAGGEYHVPGVEAGEHAARVEHPAYVCAETRVLVGPGRVTHLPAVTLRAGDANGDQQVDLFDLVLVGGSYDTRPPSDPRADLNDDGRVDVFDLVLLGGNYGLSCPAPW